MLKTGSLSLTNISLKEGMANVSFTYSGADSQKMREAVLSHSSSLSSSGKLDVGAIENGAFSFTIGMPKSSSKDLLTLIKPQALELAVKLAANKRRGRPKLPK